MGDISDDLGIFAGNSEKGIKCVDTDGSSLESTLLLPLFWLFFLTCLHRFDSDRIS